MIFSLKRFSRLNNIVWCTVAIVAVLTSCQSSPKNEEKKPQGEEAANIVQLDPTDAAYQRQLKHAKDSIGYFTTLLKAKNENQFDFFAKATFMDGEKLEHLWFSADSLVGNKIAGLLDNEPVELKNVAYKDGVMIDLKDIEDWAIYDKDSLVAGNFVTYE